MKLNARGNDFRLFFDLGIYSSSGETYSTISPHGPTLTTGSSSSWYNLKILTSTRDTLTVSAWNLLKLTQDITRAQSHILALSLRHMGSSNPRTYYDLVEVEVLPMTLSDSVYSNHGDLNMNSVSPRLVLEQDAERRKGDGCLGSVMVMSVELSKGDNRQLRDAFSQVSAAMLKFLGIIY